MRAWVQECVRAWVQECVRACVRACVCGTCFAVWLFSGVISSLAIIVFRKRDLVALI